MPALADTRGAVGSLASLEGPQTGIPEWAIIIDVSWAMRGKAAAQAWESRIFQVCVLVG